MSRERDFRKLFPNPFVSETKRGAPRNEGFVLPFAPTPEAPNPNGESEASANSQFLPLGLSVQTEPG